jgi:hypothetical protein
MMAPTVVKVILIWPGQLPETVVGAGMAQVILQVLVGDLRELAEQMEVQARLGAKIHLAALQ